ncbi:MAG: metalloregulator ArsR/SmtB family transcription factor [Armatimonadota bacterium]
MNDNDTLELKAGIIKALGHPSRLAMVEALAAGELCVCELQELVGSDMSTVSKHLTVLKHARLVCDRKQGQWVYYSLRTPCIMGFLECLEAVLKEPCECEQCGTTSRARSAACE